MFEVLSSMVLVGVAFIFAFYAALIDARHRILPNSLTMFIAVLGCAHCLLLNSLPLTHYWFLIATNLLMSLCLPGSFGMGDTKLTVGLGLFIHETLWLLMWVFVSYLTAMIWGVIRREKSIAFGPHIVMAWTLCCVGDYAHVPIPYGW